MTDIYFQMDDDLKSFKQKNGASLRDTLQSMIDFAEENDVVLVGTSPCANTMFSYRRKEYEVNKYFFGPCYLCRNFWYQLPDWVEMSCDIYMELLAQAQGKFTATRGTGM